VKISFVGKGGSGKTTLAALFARYLAAAGGSVPDATAATAVADATADGPVAGRPTALLAIDADINQHLAAALGATEHEAIMLPSLGDHLGEIKDYLRGENPRISSAAAMVKTTPPGRGSRLLPVAGANAVYDTLVREVAGIRLAVTGPFATEDLGVACYHSKVGAVELLLNHLVDGPGEYVLVDMTAGADSFASGLFTRFDATFLVCEPTLRSVGVYRQYVGYAREFGVRVHVVGNKVDDESDVEFLTEHVGDDLLTWIGRSSYVKAAERGAPQPITALEPANRRALELIRATVDASVKDWATYTRQAVEFHLRNATAWANDRVGEDLAGQVDPDFVLGPTAVDLVPTEGSPYR
jgi:CO dehydrogenase maturation factor